MQRDRLLVTEMIDALERIAELTAGHSAVVLEGDRDRSDGQVHERRRYTLRNRDRFNHRRRAAGRNRTHASIGHRICRCDMHDRHSEGPRPSPSAGSVGGSSS